MRKLVASFYADREAAGKGQVELVFEPQYLDFNAVDRGSILQNMVVESFNVMSREYETMIGLLDAAGDVFREMGIEAFDKAAASVEAKRLAKT